MVLIFKIDQVLMEIQPITCIQKIHGFHLMGQKINGNPTKSVLTTECQISNVKKKSCEHYGSAPRRATDFSYEYVVLQGISETKKKSVLSKIIFS